MKLKFKVKHLENKRVELEERLMDLIEASQDLDDFTSIYFDLEISSVLDELERLEGD